jgi:hypothetical protein
MAERCRAREGFFSLTRCPSCHMFLFCSIRGGGRGVCLRYQVSGIRYQVSGIRYQVSGVGVIAAKAVVSGKSGIGKNVYFCFGNFVSLIKTLCGIHVYFCIPGRRSRSSKIKDLAENMSTFVYFCLPFMFGPEWFCLESTD